MSVACDGDADGAIVAVHHFDPIGFLVVHDVQATVTENHPGLVDAMAENIVYVLLDVFLKGGEIGNGGFGDAATIQSPALVAVEYIDDVALGKILRTVFERRLGIINGLPEAIEVSGVSELADTPLG